MKSLSPDARDTRGLGNGARGFNRPLRSQPIWLTLDGLAGGATGTPRGAVRRAARAAGPWTSRRGTTSWTTWRSRHGTPAPHGRWAAASICRSSQVAAWATTSRGVVARFSAALPCRLRTRALTTSSGAGPGGPRASLRDLGADTAVIAETRIPTAAQHTRARDGLLEMGLAAVSHNVAAAPQAARSAKGKGRGAGRGPRPGAGRAWSPLHRGSSRGPLVLRR